MYYPPGTLKAKLCVEGRRLLYSLCAKNNIPHKKTGKLIVATQKEEVPSLQQLFQQGCANDVENLRLLEGKELLSREPHISGIAALYSAETGIVDSHCLMQYFLDAAKDKGAMVVYNAPVTAIERVAGGYCLTVKNNQESETVQAPLVINCAGLDSDTIAAYLGIDIEQLGYRLHYCKGQYFRLKDNKSRLIKGLVYPVPKPKSGGLGIHATLDLAGGLRLGPDDQYLKQRLQDYSVDNAKRDDFYASARKFMPFLQQDDLIPDCAGIRPKLQGPQDNFRDFLIQEETALGFPGFVNLIGIESPGLTAACAIARYVRALLKD
jgi:L-2-hydroxyglutarate oxidase LhgO